MSEKLLGCPFCGEIPNKIQEAPNHVEIICYWIKCTNYENCKCRPSTWMCGTPKEAVKIWNLRK